jgi:hypothetical protein
MITVEKIARRGFRLEAGMRHKADPACSFRRPSFRKGQTPRNDRTTRGNTRRRKGCARAEYADDR